MDLMCNKINTYTKKMKSKDQRHDVAKEIKRSF